jgi:hypothetical protein
MVAQELAIPTNSFLRYTAARIVEESPTSPSQYIHETAGLNNGHQYESENSIKLGRLQLLGI